ncbi:S-adenosyl-L-methionine-dependent methyltransferases superfamily protein [Wolffia australiana]
MRGLGWERISHPAAMAALDAERKIQIYGTPAASSGREVSPYWKDKYERDAKKYWDKFYKRHEDKFFKDRHYLDKEWGCHFRVQSGRKTVVLEAGCGTGNTIFPLASTFSDIFIHGCDFSERAVDLVKAHKDYREDRMNAFVCDLTADDLSDKIKPSSVDVVTLVFMLSSVSPEKMPLVVQNIRKVLRPNGRVLLRDYAAGDLAQERLTSKEQQISENFYVRGDGTRAFYFSNDFLADLFVNNGFRTLDINICHKQIHNRSLELVMNRRWIQAVFLANADEAPLLQEEKRDDCRDDHCKIKAENTDDFDISDTMSAMFDLASSPGDNMETIELGDRILRIKGLGKEFQHTCQSTGLMLWESARIMSKILTKNSSIVAGKRVLELGCGSAGICSMAAAPFAELVVATDGDPQSINLLKENLTANLPPSLLERVIVKQLVWGRVEDMAALNCCGFDIIIGTDVTYDPEAIFPLLETARKLISTSGDGETRAGSPALVLCHVPRQVSEDFVLEAASRCGFILVDRLVKGICSAGGIIKSWFSGDDDLQLGTTVNIMYFQLSH